MPIYSKAWCFCLGRSESMLLNLEASLLLEASMPPLPGAIRQRPLSQPHQQLPQQRVWHPPRQL
eukprot:2485701-Prorocentrum_lima.AAC.1